MKKLNIMDEYRLVNEVIMTNRIYNMDCLEGLRRMPDNSVDLILTDPPYFFDTKKGKGTGIVKDSKYLKEIEYMTNGFDLRILDECVRVMKKINAFFFCSREQIEEYGYNVYFKVLNAKDYGIPQNRERIILIAVKKELDNRKFCFPEPLKDVKTINDMLDDCSDLFEGTDKTVIVDTAISPYVRRNIERELDSVIHSEKGIYRPNCTSGWNDNQIGIKYSPTLRASNPNTIVMQTINTADGKKYYIKRLSPCEAYRFMGFDDVDYERQR